MILFVAYTAGVVLVLFAAIMKLVRPVPAARLIGQVLSGRAPRALTRPGSTLLLARTLGVVELAAGLTAVAHPSRITAGVVGALYLGFAAVAETGRRSGATSCGCFGGDDVPPGLAHVGADIAFAFAALVVALSHAASSHALVGTSGADVVALLLALTLAALVRLVLTSGATLRADVTALATSRAGHVHP